MQHFRVKFFAKPTAAGFKLASAIPVFHRWIQTSALPGETMIDVADYQHVPAGPGILLVCHDAYYGLDQAKHRLGLLYSRRTAQECSVQDRVRLAIEAAWRVCDLLEQAPEFAGALKFDRDSFELSVNDRLLSPNTPETFEALEKDLRPVLDLARGAGKYTVKSVGQARELLTVAVGSVAGA